MLEVGVVEKSNSPWISPVVLAKKKDKTWRFCVDYRKLNKLTTKDKFPLPRIDDLLDSLEGQCFFTSLDCFSGYWQIPLDNKSCELTAFSTPSGVYSLMSCLLVYLMRRLFSHG
jgi:hypothetical protein